ncbi:hypothetical protein CY34DRAFT_801793 [Suillus luteus UH-Slu-Lm8-n1]|uniref:Uncharacterized protein n=1 Tax=Suillus luteus UH-Slu-Lm8-n1 TaxID=930992 RepID=A0A0D0BQB0_9AGAM|nr:hypothetical protein CY34DRAFT_801793 [Suillus luteus UH-Slu-Lm8-n1]
MSFYTGVVPADGPSAQARINWSPHQQTRTNPQSQTAVRAMSNSSNFAAPATPAQAYARSVISGQPVLQYTIERQQPEQPAGQQPGPNLQSPIGASASTRGNSYAQRLYASSFGKPPQAQTQQQPSSVPGESPGNRVPAGPRAPYNARTSLMLNMGQINAPHTVSAHDFYHSSVSQLELQSPVPDRGTNSSGAPRPQVAIGSVSSVSVAHASVPSQAPHGLQASTRRGPVPVELSDRPLPSPAGDPRRLSQAELPSRSPPNAMHVMPDRPASLDLPLRPESMNNVTTSPIPSESPTREFSPPLEIYSEVVAYAEAIASNSESVTQLSDPLPEPTQTDSLDVGGSEEVPLYSLVDDEPPPPDFDESQSMCSATRASLYRTESPVVLAPPDIPSPTPHESNAVSGVVTSAEPLSESPRTSLAVPEVASYPMGKTPEDVKGKSYAYSAEVSRPEFSEKSSSYPSMEASSSSRTPPKQVPSYRQPEYYTTQNIPRPLSSPEVSPHNDSSAKTFSTTQPPVLPPRRPVVSTSAPVTASAPPPTTPAPPPMTPALPPLSPKASAVNPVEVQSATSSPLRPGSSHQQSRPSLPPRASPPSSAGTPRFVAPPARTTSQTYHAASPVPLPSPPLPRRSRGPSVPSAPSTSRRPAEFRLQLPPDVSPTLQGQAPYQSPRENFQPPAEFRPQVSPAAPPTLQGQAPYQSPRENFQPPAEFRSQVSPAVPPTLQGYAQAPYQSPRQSLQSQASPPPPPQQPRAPTSRAQPAQSSRGPGTNILTGLAGGVLGLFGGAVLAETLSDGDVVDNITQSMDGMTFGNSADGQFDPNMGTGDIMGSGFGTTGNFQGDQIFAGDSFDATANFQVDQTFAGDSFDATLNFQGDQTFAGDSTYYQGDQSLAGNSFNATPNFQGDQTFAGDATFYQVDQSFAGDSFVQTQTYDMSYQTMGNGVDPNQFQGQSSMQPDQYFVSEQFQETQQIEIIQSFNVSQPQQQQNNQSNQSSGTNYLQDANHFLQSVYKTLNTPQQTGAAQGSQGSQTMAPLQQTMMSGTPNAGRPPNSSPIGYTQTGYPTQQTGQSMHPMASQTTQPLTTTPFSQYHPSVNPASQQGTHPLSHHHASPQSSHTPHTQNPHMNHVAYPSFGTSNHTMSSQGPPIPAQYAVNHSHGTAPHHAYSPQSQAGYSAHPANYQAQGHLQQSHTGQQPPSAGLNKTMLAKQFVKGALIAGNVFANLSARNGNGDGGS